MTFTFFRSRIITCLTTLYLVQAIESKVIHQEKMSIPSSVPLKLAVSEEYMDKISDQIEPALEDYIIAKLRQNTFEALRKLTQNWEIVPKRTGRQVEGLNTAIHAVGQSLHLASTVIRSVVDILGSTIGVGKFNARVRLENSKRERIPTEKTTTTEDPDPDSRDARKLNSEYDDLLIRADSLRFSTYSDQLNGALNILVKQQDPNSPIKSETIKSTVDYILDAYVITNGKTQALFLPKLFEGIPKLS